MLPLRRLVQVSMEKDLQSLQKRLPSAWHAFHRTLTVPAVAFPTSARTIRSIPHRLRGDDIPRWIAIRGECYCRKDDFFAFNRAAD